MFSTNVLAYCHIGHFKIFWPGQLIRYNDLLRARWYEDRIPVGARFSAPVQTGPGAHPTSRLIGIGALSCGQSGPGHGVHHSLLSIVEVKERVDLYLFFLHGSFVACSSMNFKFFIS